jgi:hypothetical protein
MTRRLDWRVRRSVPSSSVAASTSSTINFPSSPSPTPYSHSSKSSGKSSPAKESVAGSVLDEPASSPPAAELVIAIPELRSLLCYGPDEMDEDVPEELYTFRVRSEKRGRAVTVRFHLTYPTNASAELSIFIFHSYASLFSYLSRSSVFYMPFFFEPRRSVTFSHTSTASSTPISPPHIGPLPLQ